MAHLPANQPMGPSFAAVDEDIAAIIEELRRQGLRLAVVSNCFAEDVRAWPTWPLAREFQCAVFSYAVGVAKPDPRMYLTATRRLAVEPGATVFIGDGGDDELAGAERVGLRAFRARWFEWGRARVGSSADTAVALASCQDLLRLAATIDSLS
ncbi:MAG TPA: HAD-IA family hydrolase [Vicinamibacterales bacterium]|nr:HAD-IA family hydrolase [Vicinamibacterales bacterium]